MQNTRSPQEKKTLHGLSAAFQINFTAASYQLEVSRPWATLSHNEVANK